MNYSACNPNLLSRFFDQELGPEEYALEREHVIHCASCQRAMREKEALSRIFTANLDQQVSNADLERVEERIFERIQKQKAPREIRLRDLLASRRFYVPATAAAAALVLFVFLMRDPLSGPGPSAIISSFEGDVASVIILETPESHQTILWISESVIANGGDGKNGQT